jgi:hypothetical protein
LRLNLKFSRLRFHPASVSGISTEVVPPNTQNLINDLRERLRALDLAIATFERLASLREQEEPVRQRKPKPGKTARSRPSPQSR